MSIYRVIDKLETYVREGTWVPLGHRILSEERLMEYIEKMRSTLPEEVGRAKVIATNKDRVIRDAQERAQQIVTEAVAQKNELVEQQDVVRAARTTADIVLARSRGEGSQNTFRRRLLCGDGAGRTRNAAGDRARLRAEGA